MENYSLGKKIILVVSSGSFGPSRNTQYFELLAISRSGFMKSERSIIFNVFDRPRNSITSPDTVISWNGSVRKASEPNDVTFKLPPAGSYKIQFNALKQFKQAPLDIAILLNTIDYDTFTSVPFNLMYSLSKVSSQTSTLCIIYTTNKQEGRNGF